MPVQLYHFFTHRSYVVVSICGLYTDEIVEDVTVDASGVFFDFSNVDLLNIPSIIFVLRVHKCVGRASADAASQ